MGHMEDIPYMGNTGVCRSTGYAFYLWNWVDLLPHTKRNYKDKNVDRFESHATHFIETESRQLS